MSARTHLVCAWTGVVAVAFVLAGFLVAGYFVPPEAHLSAQELAAFYSDDTDLIRLGVLLFLIGFAGWGTLMASMSKLLRRIGDDSSPLPALVLVAGGTGFTFLLLFAMFLGAAAFRPERAPEITQVVHDLGWYFAFLSATPFALTAIAIGVRILQDKAERPVFPRWTGYFNLWIAVLLLPGEFLIFFKRGMLAYHGVLSYWIPLVAFASWMLVLAWSIRHAASASAPAGGRVADAHDQV